MMDSPPTVVLLLIAACLLVGGCSGSGQVQARKPSDSRAGLRKTKLSNALKNDQMQMEIDNASTRGNANAAPDERVLIDQFLVDADQKAQRIASKIEASASLPTEGQGNPRQAALLTRADQVLDGFLDACRIWAKDAKTLQQAQTGCTGLTSLAAQVLVPAEQK
jgi:hypothetical protein